MIKLPAYTKLVFDDRRVGWLLVHGREIRIEDIGCKPDGSDCGAVLNAWFAAHDGAFAVTCKS